MVEQRAPASVVETPASRTPTLPLRVLFVCTANICRSPYMELRAAQLAGEDPSVVFTSAGTHGFRDHVMNDVMASTLTGRGVESATFSSRPLTRALVEEADLILTAEGTHRTFILDDHPATFRKVFTLGQFAEAIGHVEADLSGRGLLEALGERRGSAGAHSDVPDPFGRGPAAAESCARQVDELLRVVVPSLIDTRKIPVWKT